MRIKCDKPSITDYDFLRLLTSTIVSQYKVPIFENQQLQKDLYDFYNNPDFTFLFEDVCKKSNYVDLGDAFQSAYAWGLLSIIQNSDNLKSIIHLSEEEAQKNISQFNQRQANAMNELVSQLYLPKKVDKPHTLAKKII